MTRLLMFVGLMCVATATTAYSQDALPPSAAYDATLWSPLQFRCIGPFRGGRSCAVAGVADRPTWFYLGATGGGVWKTEDSGTTWRSLSDGYFGGSIGSIAVASSDRNVLYAGGGEVTVRGNVSHGEGVWRSRDGGETWQHMGLDDSRHIPRIRIHPDDPDTVYVAALGHLYGPNRQRGVFRSRDGGENWEQVLFVSENAGAVDLIMDPGNARVLYASTWNVLRTPYGLSSGGDGSGLWKSTDGGDTWENISNRPGLPEGIWGISGITVSPVDSKRLWAIVEASEGGVFRSNDGGATWRRVNSERSLRQRAWYYSRIYAGPTSRDEVYVLNVRMWRSNDGGESFNSISTPHSDHHDLWIDPLDRERMVVADDGGAQVSFNAGQSWSTYMNQPTAQFYRVTTDNAFPYRIYGAQQDNSTVRIHHRVAGGSIGESDWEATAGGESGFLAPDPTDPEIVFGGSYGGYLQRYDHRSKEVSLVNVWPDNPMGYGAADLRYRFQWNFPIFFSPHDPKTLYAAANVLFKTNDGGQSWKQISPDLTRDVKSRQGSSGGPITKDNTSVEYYCTIFASLESPHEAGVLWAGSDDGLVHISRDAGKNWQNVTPPALPEWAQINSLESHPWEAGGLYLAATRYKSDDFQPLLFKTLDYGATWTRIDKGIDRHHFTRVIRADPGRRGLLYAGTESGLYLSWDDGLSWRPFQQNLPVVPITDLAVHQGDLIVATQGRSFWVLDDLSLLHQLNPADARAAHRLFSPRPLYRIRGGSFRSLTAGQNARGEAVLRVWLRDVPPKEQNLHLDILDSNGTLIRRFSRTPQDGESSWDATTAMNELTWNLRYASAKTFAGMVLWGGGTSGPLAIPGEYLVRLTVGEATEEVPLKLLADPRSSATEQDYQLQFQFLLEVRDKLTATHEAIEGIRDVRGQIDALIKRLKDRDGADEVKKAAQQVLSDLKEVEESLYQTKNQSPQDPLNFPIRLNNKLSSLASNVAAGNRRPTKQALAFREELVQAIDEQLNQLNKILAKDVARLNQLVKQNQVPAIFVPQKD